MTVKEHSTDTPENLNNGVQDRLQAACQIKQEHPVDDIADYLTIYWSSYMNQHNAAEYSLETILSDAIYGVGASLSRDYRSAGGYDKFLIHLSVWIQLEADKRNLTLPSQQADKSGGAL